MTIRVKLSILILSLLLAFAASAVTYVASVGRTARIRRDERVLAQLKTVLLDESITAHEMLTARFSTQEGLLQAGIMETGKEFSAVLSLKTLPMVSASVRGALDSIHRLECLTDDATKSFTATLDAVERDAKVAYGFTDTFTALDLATGKNLTSSGGRGQTLQDVAAMVTQLEILTNSLQASVGVIDDQGATISREVARITAESSVIVVVVVLVLVALAVALALVVANRIVRSVRSIEGSVAGMTEGDLTRSFQVESRDEIGRLSTNLNRFIASLSGSLRGVQAASGIAGSIRGLNEEIQEQMAMVEESTASVTEMIASIESVAKITENTQAIGETMATVQRISGEVRSGMGEIARGIKEISDAVANVLSIAERLGELGESLNREITRFKTA